MEWSEETALRWLKERGHMPIDHVFELAKDEAPGLKHWSALDFLKHHCGYKVHRAR